MSQGLNLNCRHALLFAVAVSLAGIIIPSEARGFEYLEHSYFSDRACWQAQMELRTLLEERPDDRALRSRYLAMALACPERSPDHYCIDEEKAVTAQINRVGGRAWEQSEHPMTLGDMTALGDHLATFGPIRGLSGGRKPGLMQDVMEWFSDDDPGVGGVLGRVARRSCYNSEDVSWREVEADVDAVAPALLSGTKPAQIPAPLLNPLARGDIEKGPGDPEVRFTISNPHYLDLVLRNHLHFGDEAFDTWLGFHSAAIEIAERPCEATFAMEYRAVQSMADDLPGFEDLDWRAMSDAQLASEGCAMLAERARIRLLQWARHADPRLVEPVTSFLQALQGIDELDDEQRLQVEGELEEILVSLKALIFQGSGLHYLQDGLAGGHVRTIRTRGGLAESRHDHNYDNEEGVSAILRTRAGDFPFVAYGDQFMLGRHRSSPEHCDWQELHEESAHPDDVAACLLRYQRGLVVATSTASLVDWAVGGMMFEPVEADRCASSELESSVCDILPLSPISAVGSLPPRELISTSGLHPGNLPVPPPAFGYESLVTTVAFDVAGSKSQYGLQLTMPTQFDRFAHWLTSYRAALLGSTGSEAGNEVLGEFSYNFHYRISARVMAEAGLGAFAGFRGIGDSLSFMSGLGPNAGLVVLPEGWIKMPLDLSVSFRLPMTFFTSTHGFFSDSFNIEAFWLQLGLGLAFM